MPDQPFSLRVLHALTNALKEITPDNDFVADMADFEVEENGETIQKVRVFRGRDEFGFNDPRPMLSILEHPAAIEQILGPADDTAQHGDWEILIQGFVTDDADNPTDPAHHLAAEVVKRLAQEKVRVDPSTHSPDILGLGYREPCVTGMKIGKPVCRPPDGQVSDVAFFYLRLTLTLLEDQDAPFA